MRFNNAKRIAHRVTKENESFHSVVKLQRILLDTDFKYCNSAVTESYTGKQRFDWTTL